MRNYKKLIKFSIIVFGFIIVAALAVVSSNNNAPTPYERMFFVNVNSEQNEQPASEKPCTNIHNCFSIVKSTTHYKNA